MPVENMSETTAGKMGDTSANTERSGTLEVATQNNPHTNSDSLGMMDINVIQLAKELGEMKAKLAAIEKPGEEGENSTMETFDLMAYDKFQSQQVRRPFARSSRRRREQLISQIITLDRESELDGRDKQELYDKIEAFEEKEKAWEAERAEMQQLLRMANINTNKNNPVDQEEEEEKEPKDDDSNATAHEIEMEKKRKIARRRMVPQVNQVGWDMFMGLMGRTQRQTFCIDVLDGEPVITSDTWYSLGWGKHSLYGGVNNPTRESFRKTESTPGVAAVPERIRINSSHILELIRSFDEDNKWTFTLSVVMIRPYRLLAFYEERIRQRTKEIQAKVEEKEGAGSTNEPDEETLRGFDIAQLQHLQCLVDFMDEELQRKIKYLSSEECQKVVFSDLWYLFKPGDTVIDFNQQQAYRVIHVACTSHKVIPPFRRFDKSDKSDDTPVNIDCVYIDFDGKQLGPVKKSFEVVRFDGEKAVTSLPVYPLRFAQGRSREGLREQFLARGRRFVEVAHVMHMHYNGFTLEGREEVDSQVVIDFEEAFSAMKSHDWRPNVEQLIGSSPESTSKDVDCTADCCLGDHILKDSFVDKKRHDEYIQSLIPNDRIREPSVAIYPRTLQDTKSPENELSDEEYLIMSYRVFGFVLRSRKWAKLDISYLSPIGSTKKNDGDEEGATEKEKKRETPFDQLVLPAGHKNMVLSLVAQHFRDRENITMDNDSADIVRGKGKGLIILLHGAPGVGKTTTAEGVAELFQKPLFQITCGDLGTTAGEVEKALETHFALASRWKSILLLDEADVFLAARNPQDFVRNGLVAVFLRVLEYYSGILFLTTNRIGDFDEAFASRIHISLHYPPLSLRSTKEIFRLNLGLIHKRFNEGKRKIDIDNESIMDAVSEYYNDNEKMRLNGRQIRNACHTALALAEFEAQGGSHEKILHAQAEVKLKVNHIDTVQHAYLDFILYLRDIFGEHAEKRAKHMRIRAGDPKGEDGSSKRQKEPPSFPPMPPANPMNSAYSPAAYTPQPYGQPPTFQTGYGYQPSPQNHQGPYQAFPPQFTDSAPTQMGMPDPRQR